MATEGVYYIRVPPYKETMLISDMAHRYVNTYGRAAHPQFAPRLGQALLDIGYLDDHASFPGSGRHHTDWIRQHIGRFIQLGQPEVTRRRARRRGGGLTRRRRHALLWL